MGLVIGFAMSLIISWVISESYRKNYVPSKLNSRTKDHGALEFNLSFFCINSLFLGFYTELPLFFLIAAVLGLFLSRRFIINEKIKSELSSQINNDQ